MSDARFPRARELNLASGFSTVVYSSYSAKAGNRRRFISRTHVRTEPTRIDVFLEQPSSSIRNSMGSCVLLATLTLRCPASDPAMARHVQQYLDTIASRPHATTCAKVRECIYLMLSSGLCSAAQVAKRLGTDRRTIHRHLAKEGETFTSLMESVRSELVTRYIENRDRPLSQTADLLGFSAQSAFARWFRAKFGCSVSEWRAAQSTPASNR